MRKEIESPESNVMPDLIKNHLRPPRLMPGSQGCHAKA
jgi:hypothetical protein